MLIKPRQIINYDAGIVLIDLHQLNVKQLQMATKRIGIRGNLMSTKNRTRRTTTRNIRFLTKWLNKLTSLLSKRVRNFSAWVIEACRRRLTSEKRVYTTQSDEESSSRVLPSEQDDIVNSLNYEGIAVRMSCSFTTFPTVTETACWLCHRLNSLND